MSLSGLTVSFFRRRIINPVANLLKQGMTPHKLAVTVALGTVVGVVPAFGLTTVMGTALAARFRLNIAATILISYLMQPLQIIFFIPFVRAGIFMFGLEELRFTFDEITSMFKADWLAALNLLWKANLAAVSAWALLALPVGFVLYLLVLPLLNRFLPKKVQV
ncbi:DUF2062 domain-containing protein [Pontibacter sp. H249]|uniref:DUF2062 domain-containing protein n=1 Tax=Pontibacter sp. H249 TaxID=3133420 RepID=UPI0030C4D038